MFPAPQTPILLSDVSTDFLEYARVVLGFAPESITKYRDCLRQIERVTGIREFSQFSDTDLFGLRLYMVEKKHSASRQTSILYTLKGLLEYLRDDQHREIQLDPRTIRFPKHPRREVTYLSPDEVQRLVESIRLSTRRGRPCLAGYRLRALIEVLLGTAMRISEALSLQRTQLDVERREARIIGKGNKQRVVFFTERSLHWLQQYLSLRADNHAGIFVSLDGETPWKRADIWRYFARLRLKSGIAKPLRPHILRHTAATQLLFNGCPIGHIKEILGHERLETTCKYYLGLDRRAAKAAHDRYLCFESSGMQLGVS